MAKSPLDEQVCHTVASIRPIPDLDRYDLVCECGATKSIDGIELSEITKLAKAATKAKK